MAMRLQADLVLGSSGKVGVDRPHHIVGQPHKSALLLEIATQPLGNPVALVGRVDHAARRGWPVEEIPVEGRCENRWMGVSGSTTGFALLSSWRNARASLLGKPSAL